MVSTLNKHVCNRVYLNVPYCSSAFLSSGLLFLGPDPPAWNAETRYIHMKLMKKYSDEYFHVEISIYYIYINLFGYLALLLHGPLVDDDLHLHGGAHEEV